MMYTPYRTLTLLVVPSLILMLLVNVAFAAVGPDDPGGTILELATMLSQGKYLPAVGCLMILWTAGVRAGAATWISDWFATKPGGYVVGYSSALALELGVGLAAGHGFSLAMMLQAIALGWTASGGWETARDFADWLIRRLKNKTDPAPSPAPPAT